MKTILQLLFTCLLSTVNAQQQIIVQLQYEKKVAEITNNRSFPNLISAKLQFKKRLSESLNIHLLEFDSMQTDPFKLLAAIKNHPAVKYAQFNAHVDIRSVPNDDLLCQQWQYQNEGISGKYDADIDALEAWSITTGGTTVEGDEIVVAILDGGVNLNHPDLEDNIWTNKGEIPNNNIDDDNNGYVDDYYGWNFNERNNDITNQALGSWHGTPVAGIIGAKGNNGIGVSGVNWKVKLMMLAANEEVDDIIEAYDYILQLRKKYNDTNGQEGAFIVATNASIGIGGAQPTDHPIWCEMYNLLGQEGILSVAATANASIDVDQVGDLPTTCTSDFLITVTNTTVDDELDSFAAYGTTHIDLGAPGNGTFTLTNEDDYGRFGGTSAASPHVAGAVALLYSTPIPQFINEVKQNPTKAALLIKKSILDGTDPLNDLHLKSVSGGRLNLHQSLVNLHKQFGIISQPNQTKIEAPYPNPTSDKVMMSFELLDKSNVSIQLYNNLGQLVLTDLESTLNKGKHWRTISLSAYSKGVYFIHFRVDNLTIHETFKIVLW